MSNTFNQMKDAPGVIAKAAARMLSDQLQFIKSIDTSPERDFDGMNGYSAGNTIQISKPARFLPQTTLDITSTQQAITEEKVPLVLNITSTVGMNMTSLEFATEADVRSVIKRVVKPAVESIAHDIEKRFLQLGTQATYNCVGTAGTTIFDTDAVLSAKEKLSKYLCPQDDQRYFLHDSTSGRSAVNARKGLFQDSAEVSKQYKNGVVGKSDGFTWLQNELIYNHTMGNDVTGITMASTVSTQGTSTLALTGMTTTTGTIKKGTVFTIANCNAVNPITKQVYPFLQQFVATADLTADGSGLGTLSISPAMYTTANGLQNLDALPQSGAALVFVGAASTTYTQNLCYHKDAFRMVSVPMIMPKNVELAVQETYQDVTIAVVRAFDVNTRNMITRLDFLGGFVAVRPEWSVRITG